MVGGPPRRLLILAAALLAACAGTPDRDHSPDEGGREVREVPLHETYVRNPTEIRARNVTAILPAAYGPELAVSGLSSGWTDAGNGKREWSGTGDCRLALFELEVKCRELTVTLVPDQPTPEVLLTARGDVVLAHVSKRIGNLAQGLSFLMIRNEKRIER